MLRQIRNYRFNPFTASNSFTVITDEVHAIPGSGTYWVRLNEVPDENYTDPTSGTPVYIRTSGGTPLTEVSSSPGLNQFRVDYDYKTGWVEFNSGNADDIILVCYRGTGSPVEAELINSLQKFDPATPIFCGDGSDGSATISTNTNLAEDPSGSDIVLKQYSDLTINASIQLGIVSGCKGLILAVQGILKLNNNAIITVDGRAATGGAAGTAAIGYYGGPGVDAGFGGGGGGGGYDKSGGAGGGNEGIGPGPGISGSGGPDQTAGEAGSNTLVAGADLYWRSLVNQAVFGSGGGGGAASAADDGGAGGNGGGFLIINCNVLEVGSGVAINAKGDDGGDGGAGGGTGGGGGGAGGTIIILANRIVGITAATLESTNCDISGGSGGAGQTTGEDGGAGADGFKRVVELYEYNIY